MSAPRLSPVASSCAPVDDLAVLRREASRLKAAGRLLEARAVSRCVDLLRQQRKAQLLA